MKLTKATIARLKLPEGKTDVIFFDDDDPGFGLRIRAGGKRTWIVQYRVGKMQRRITLGAVNALHPDKARKAARDRPPRLPSAVTHNAIGWRGGPAPR